ncbi:MAG: hypothetical protein WCA79_14885 [Anaerolineales bacterium]
MDDAVLKKRVKSTETLISISSEHEMQTVQPLRVDGEVVAMTGGVNHHMEKAQLGERSADLEELIATATKVQGEAKSEKQITNSRIDRSEFANLTNYIFGSSAAIITEVSLIVGLGAARASKGAILGGLLTIALADNISDSLGIHMYKESEGCEKRLSLLATILNFLSRLLICLSFVAIVLLFPISQAITVGIVWGLLLLIFISYLITKSNHESSISEIIKHVLVAVIVILLSRYVGYLIAEAF